LAARAIAILLLPLTIVPLIMEPDFGQTMLISLVWAALFFMAGVHWLWVAGLGGVGMAGGLAAFKLSSHVHERVLRFIDPDSTRGMGDAFQVDTALQSILSGGWFGRGPGEGVVKRILPDAHTDFVFAVTGEEFGMVACLALIAFFGFIVVRGLWLALRNQDPFCRFAAAGLALMFGVQSWINMAVNLRAIPAKGTTLPFVSYGGSSLLALAVGMGFLIALTRKRPQSELGAKPSSAS
jgi:cell division protein FtsW